MHDEGNGLFGRRIDTSQEAASTNRYPEHECRADLRGRTRLDVQLALKLT